MKKATFVAIWVLLFGFAPWIVWKVVPPGWGVFMLKGEKDVWCLLASFGVFTGILTFIAIFNQSEIVTIRGPISKSERDIGFGRLLGFVSLGATIAILSILALIGWVFRVSVVPHGIIERVTSFGVVDPAEKWGLMACLVNAVTVYLALFVLGLRYIHNRGEAWPKWMR